MATVITSECINCGACEPECPNTAIYQGGVEWEFNGQKSAPISADIFYIVPQKCTECVGFFDHEACAAVCPVDCCVPDPAIPETEAALFARAKELHPGEAFAAEFPSRFRKDGAAPVPASGDAAPTAPSTPVAVPAASAPVAADATLAIPPMDEWEIPIECFHCHGTYAVEFKHFRSGVVFNCPFCSGTYVVGSAMHNTVYRHLTQFHDRWRREFQQLQDKRQRELDAFEEHQRQELETFTAALRQISLEMKPAGAPRKRAGIFG